MKAYTIQSIDGTILPSIRKNPNEVHVHKCGEYLGIVLQIRHFFNWKVVISFLFLHKNICCRYSLEAPCQGASNVYLQNIFFVEKLLFIGYFLLSRTMLLILPVIYCSSDLVPGFVCVQVLRPSHSNGVMSSAVSLPNHTFTGQACPLSG